MGEDAYSFTYTKGNELGILEGVQELTTVIHDDTGYIFGFTGTTATFDDSENVEIRERLLDSIRFLDGGGNDPEDEGGEEGGDEDEE